jgi:quercetin dioxygenase-like cupin family protein
MTSAPSYTRSVSGEASVDVKNLDAPDRSWRFLDQSERVVVHVGRVAIGRGVYRLGWRWSEHVQPLSGKPSEEHIGYLLSGRMAVRARDGVEVELAPGDAFTVSAGHDAWVVGDDPCVALDFTSS